MDKSVTLDALLSAAKRAGADQADASMLCASSRAVTVRLGLLENGEHADTVKLGLRVFLGQRVATVSTTVSDPAHFDTLAAQAVAMARALPENPHAGLAEPALKGQLDAESMSLADDATSPSMRQLQEAAQFAEETARAGVGIANSNGASASAWRGETSFADTDGFYGTCDETIFGLSVSVVAGQGETMQRDYASDVARKWRELAEAEDLGADAAERARQRLNPRKPATGVMPVVFDPRVSGSLLGHFAAAINGAAIARGTSFLSSAMGTQILPDHLSIIDDPTRCGGLASRLFDGEGVLPRQLRLVENGRLQHWLLDQASALQLGLTNNGCARRAPGGTPSPSSSNLYLTGGLVGPEELISDIREGVYITEMIGTTINMLTGDYSRGASGFMIKNGHIDEPVAGLTVAGHLEQMFKSMQAADDLIFRRSINAPTLRIDDLKVAGE